MVAESTLPALDSNPLSIIGVVGEKMGCARLQGCHSRNLLPNLMEIMALNEPGCHPGQFIREWRGGKAAVPQALARTAASAATPYTDRGVEFRRSK